LIGASYQRRQDNNYENFHFFSYQSLRHRATNDINTDRTHKNKQD